MKIGQRVYDLSHLDRGPGVFNGYGRNRYGQRHARVKYPDSKWPAKVRVEYLSLCPYRVERRHNDVTRWMAATGLSEAQVRESLR